MDKNKLNSELVADINSERGSNFRFSNKSEFINDVKTWEKFDIIEIIDEQDSDNEVTFEVEINESVDRELREQFDRHLLNASSMTIPSGPDGDLWTVMYDESLQ